MDEILKGKNYSDGTKGKRIHVMNTEVTGEKPSQTYSTYTCVIFIDTSEVVIQEWVSVRVAWSKLMYMYGRSNPRSPFLSYVYGKYT